MEGFVTLSGQEFSYYELNRDIVLLISVIGSY
ncbi:unnamed protein product, partial [Rotaria sordida]